MLVKYNKNVNYKKCTPPKFHEKYQSQYVEIDILISNDDYVIYRDEIDL